MPHCCLFFMRPQKERSSPLRVVGTGIALPAEMYLRRFRQGCIKCLRFVLPVALTCTGCIGLKPDFPSSDCRGAAPAGFTRIFIGAPAPKGSQSGTSADDPLDGKTAEKFDAILRSIVEGKFPTWGAQQNIGPENVVVCIASGTFATNGFEHVTPGAPSADLQAGDAGFAVGKNWRIHGQGAKHTKLLLTGYRAHQFANSDGSTFNGGVNTVISTHSVDASGVEISDLTIDANHDGMTSPGGLPLNLQAISLRSVQGGNWIHDVTVIGASDDAGIFNIVNENFAVQIWGEPSAAGRSESAENLIENVTVTKPGRPMFSGEFPGGKMDGIVVNNAEAEVRNNVVKGVFIAYGGWSMGSVNFHDNIAKDTAYGFNADTLSNNGVKLQSNQIIHPASYGIVIGGGSPDQKFSGWTVANNTIVLGASESTGIILRGQVRDSTFSGNTIIADRPVRNAAGIVSYAAANGVANFSNVFEQNQVDRILRVDFSQDANFNSDCRFMNRDRGGNSLPGFGDNSSGSCGTGTTPRDVVR